MWIFDKQQINSIIVCIHLFNICPVSIREADGREQGIPLENRLNVDSRVGSIRARLMNGESVNG
jgi:hypothetical protein